MVSMKMVIRMMKKIMIMTVMMMMMMMMKMIMMRMIMIRLRENYNDKNECCEK